MNVSISPIPLVAVPASIKSVEATKENSELSSSFSTLLFSALPPPKIEHGGDLADGGVSTPSDVALLEQTAVLPASAIDHPARPEESLTPIDGSMQVAMGAVLGSPSPEQPEIPNEARALIPDP